MRAWILICGLFFITDAYSQPRKNVKVIGVLIDSVTNKALSKSDVVIKNSGRSISLQTDSKGNFATELNYFTTSEIAIDVNNYELEVVNNYNVNAGVVDLGRLILTAKSTVLNEVLIKGKRRYRDTTKIDLSGEKFDRAVMVDDLFSTHGFSKDVDGKLRYNGKVIGNLLVNGRDFFGKNNMDIYKLLPALTLKGIEVLETNIDSVTNTTLLRPTIDVDLKLKDQYTNGGFGSVIGGMGTGNRYIGGTGLYGYRDKKQLSVSLGSNNINIRNIPLTEPAISFSANGNNVRSEIADLTYNNAVSKKLDIDFMARGKIDNGLISSISERHDVLINQYSKTQNDANTESVSIPESRFKLSYKIDSLNLVQFVQTFNYSKTNSSNVTSYLIQSEGLNYASRLTKQQDSYSNGISTTLSYRRAFHSKKGRNLNISLGYLTSKNNTNETDSVYNFLLSGIKTYYIKSYRLVNNNLANINLNFTEPLNENSYLALSAAYKNDRLNYRPEVSSDSLLALLTTPVQVLNHYLQTGTQFHQVLKKISLDATVLLLYNKRENRETNTTTGVSFFNVGFDSKADYHIDKDHDVSFIYNASTRYPEKNEMINVNASYDLISQIGNNLQLKPEVKNSLKLNFDSRNEKWGGFNIIGGVDFYSSKIATTINFETGKPQTMYYDNIGNVFSAQLAFGLYKNASQNFSFNYNNSVTYQQQPIVVNKQKNMNSSWSFNQVVTTTKNIIKNVLTVSPIITSTFTKFHFESSTINVVTASYSDRVSLSVAKFKLDVLPLVNYSRSVNSLTSLSMNASLSRPVFKTGLVWLQGYDLFNSFKYNNNFGNAAYVQTVKYSNVSRYFIVGFNLKFNNIK